MEISPYSLSHDWSLYWTRVPSNVKRSPYINGESPKEMKALEALAALGVFEGRQLTRLYSLDKKRLKRMVAERKLVRHEIHRNKQGIPIYTLGINGAVITGMEDYYESNYWVMFKTEEVLKCLLFAQLLRLFPNSRVIPTPEPFNGAVEHRGKRIYVYVLRGDANDLTMYLKWKGSHFNERLIIVTESLTHLQSLLMSKGAVKIRSILDKDLIKSTDEFQKRFYYLNEYGKFIMER